MSHHIISYYILSHYNMLFDYMILYVDCIFVLDYIILYCKVSYKFCFTKLYITISYDIILYSLSLYTYTYIYIYIYIHIMFHYIMLRFIISCYILRFWCVFYFLIQIPAKKGGSLGGGYFYVLLYFHHFTLCYAMVYYVIAHYSVFLYCFLSKNCYMYIYTHSLARHA